MITERQLLQQFQGIDRSLDLMRQAILTLSRHQLELLQLLGNLEQQQLQTKLPSLNPRVERFLSSIIRTHYE